jgi:glycosyltransferase involved in cell wall biosynthesis
LSNFKISVACCTYNGERFILEQLQSMAEQTRVPDEVIICDDGSSDNTIPIIKSFATKAPFPIQLFENAGEPLRSTKNFEKAIKLCSGEIIFLSDQDDVWLPSKVEVLAKAIEGGAGLVFSDASLVDENLNPLSYSLFDSLDLNKVEKSQISESNLIDILMHRNIVTGAGMAFSSKHLPTILPISVNWIHDGWIAFLISSIDKVVISSEKLFLYRQHSKNQIGSKKLSTKEKLKLVQLRSNKYYFELLEGFKDLKNHLARLPLDNNLSSLLKKIEYKIQHLQVRTCVVNPQFSSMFSLLNELFNGRYHRYSRHWVSFSRDVAMLLLNVINKYKLLNNEAKVEKR